MDFDRLKSVLLSQSEEVVSFYNAVQDEEVADLLRRTHATGAKRIGRQELHADASAVIRDHYGGGSDDGEYRPGLLILPNPMIQNRLKTDHPSLMDKNDGTKMMRFNFRKRQIFVPPSRHRDSEIAKIRSLPWGWGSRSFVPRENF